jgi:hypothetical protein
MSLANQAQTQQQSEQSATDSATDSVAVAETSAASAITVDTQRNDVSNNADGAALTASSMNSQTAGDSMPEAVALSMEVTADVISSTSAQQDEPQTDSSVVLTSSDAITTSQDTVDTFAEISQLEIRVTDDSAQQADLVAAVIQQSLATAQAFNVVPRVDDLERAGAINVRADDRSDAEKRADEVMAANDKEQAEINANYMDADQGGIVAAMGADTDVAAYRSAMLRDNSTWYRPEDIYRNNVLRDNTRGAYYLEKGNTDTFRRLIDSQYR